MATEPRRSVRLGQGGSASVTYTLPQDTAFRVESVSFTLDNTVGAISADPTVIYRDQAGNLIYAQIVGAALAVGSTMIYSASPFGDPCGVGFTALGNTTPDTIASITLVEGCSLTIQAARSDTGADVSGAKVNSPFAWVEPLESSGLEDAIPFLTPVAAGEQLAA